jgi:hypothetical protein
LDLPSLHKNVSGKSKFSTWNLLDERVYEEHGDEERDGLLWIEYRRQNKNRKDITSKLAKNSVSSCPGPALQTQHQYIIATRSFALHPTDDNEERDHECGDLLCVC